MPRLNARFRIVTLFVSLFPTLIVVAQESTPINTGDTMTGTLSADASSFNYDLQPSETGLLLTATSDTFNPTLGLGYASGTGGNISVSFDGDVGNPLFIPPLAQGQSAQVQVTSTSFPAEGDFTLTAVAVEPTPIQAGSSAEGSIGADGAPQYFSFAGQLGQLVTVTAQGGNFDTRVQLFTPGSIRRIAEDNDGGVGYDPEIYQAVLTGNGVGYIEVAPAFTGEGGTFSVSVSVTDPPTVADGAPITMRLGGARGTGALTFAGTAGGSTQVSVAGVGGETEGAEIAIYQDGNLLASENRFEPGETPTLFEVSTASDSPVYIIITADTRFDEAVEGQFEVSINQV